MFMDCYGLLWVSTDCFPGVKVSYSAPSLWPSLQCPEPNTGTEVDPEVSQRLFPAQKPVESDVNSTQLRFQKTKMN